MKKIIALAEIVVASYVIVSVGPSVIYKGMEAIDNTRCRIKLKMINKKIEKCHNLRIKNEELFKTVNELIIKCNSSSEVSEKNRLLDKIKKHLDSINENGEWVQ